MKHPMTKMFLIFSSIALILIVSACGGADESQPAPTAEPVGPQSGALSVEMHDIYFGDENTNVQQPPVWTVNAGDEVSLELINLGNLEHNWAVVEMGQEVPVPYVGGEDDADLFYFAADAIAGGETETYSFIAPDVAGTYLVICTVPGHYPLMQGQLEVE